MIDRKEELRQAFRRAEARAIPALGWRQELSDATTRSYVVLRNGWRAIYDRERSYRELRVLGNRWTLTLRRRNRG